MPMTTVSGIGTTQAWRATERQQRTTNGPAIVAQSVEWLGAFSPRRLAAHGSPRADRGIEFGRKQVNNSPAAAAAHHMTYLIVASLTASVAYMVFVILV